MTVATLNMRPDSFVRYSMAMTTLAGVADWIPGNAVRTSSALHQDQVNFARAWARWEPAFVAQQYREWFGC